MKKSLSLFDFEIDRVFISQAELVAPWSIEMPSLPGRLLFHLVLEGDAWVSNLGRIKTARRLSKGQFGIVTQGQAHRFSCEKNEAGVPLFEIPRQELSASFEFFKFGAPNGTVKTFTLCGAVFLRDPLAKMIQVELPPYLMVNDWEPDDVDWISKTFQILLKEARHSEFASSQILLNLSEALIFKGLRRWLAQNGSKLPTMRAFADPQIYKAMREIEKAPGLKWSTVRIAKVTGMSRSALHQRFRRLLNKSPAEFVRNWKMQMAKNWLIEDRKTISEISDLLGYKSEAAFARSFKKVIGQSPGRMKSSK